MGKQYQYVSIDRIISKLYRDLGLEEIVEIDTIEWAGEALEAIGAGAIYEDAICLLKVNNYSAELPPGLHSIVQVARDNEMQDSDTVEDCMCKELEETAQPVQEDITNDIVIKPSLFFTTGIPYNIQKWLSCNFYKERFTPVRLSNHTFFDSIVYKENQSEYLNSKDEYTIQRNKIKTSFEEGYIVLSYKRQMLDEETCYPLVPDSYSYITAITKYITWKMFTRMWYMGREGDYRNMSMKAEEEWHWYCKQASNESFILYGVDEHQNFLENKLKLLPNHNSYYGFFGKLNERDFNGPGDVNGFGSNKNNYRV